MEIRQIPLPDGGEYILGNLLGYYLEGKEEQIDS